MTKLVVISAPSGAGKTTLCSKLLEEFRSSLVLSISSTTRAPRGKEKNGVEYIFLTPAEFEAQIRAGDFAEWAKVHGNYYGTSKKVIERAFAGGKSVLLDIDVQGADSLTKAYPDQCVRIFISPPSLVALEARLRARGTDKEETIQKRLQNARDEMARAPDFHHNIVNDDLGRACEELCGIVRKELGGHVG